MLNMMPLADKHEGEELRKEANSTHVAGLNVTENQQDREDSGKESSRRRERARERRQRQGAITRASERFSKNANKRGTNSLA